MTESPPSRKSRDVADALLSLLAIADKIRTLLRSTLGVAEISRSLKAQFETAGAQFRLGILQPPIDARQKSIVPFVSESLLRTGLWKTLKNNCINLRRLARTARSAVASQLPLFAGVRETPFTHDALPGESGAAATWNHVVALAREIRWTSRVRSGAKKAPAFADLVRRERQLENLIGRLLPLFEGIKETDYGHLVAALRWEISRIDGRAENANAEKQPPANQEALSIEARAIGFLRDHPEWTNVEIAQATGCSREYLSRSPLFKTARAALRGRDARTDRHERMRGRRREMPRSGDSEEAEVEET